MPVPTGNGHWVSRHASRRVPIALPRLEENLELSLTTRQESWCHCTNTRFEGLSPFWLEKIPQVTAETRGKLWVFPDNARWGMIPLHYLQNNSVFHIKLTRSLDFPDGTPDSRQGHCHNLVGPWSHPSNTKDICVPQINSSSGRIPLRWLQSHPAFPIQHNRWLDFLKKLKIFTENSAPCTEGHQFHHRN